MTLQKISKNYFDTFMAQHVVFLNIPLAPSVSEFPNNLALYLKDLGQNKIWICQISCGSFYF